MITPDRQSLSGSSARGGGFRYALTAGRTIPLADHQVHVVEAGSGPDLVLVHGSPVSSFTFRHQIPRLSERFRVIAPDLLGFGQSIGPPGGSSFVLQVEMLDQLLQILEVDRYRLVVHDWGGPIGLGCAARNPGSLSRLVLINTTIRPGFRPPLYWRPFVARWLGELFVVRLNLVRRSLRSLIQAARRDPEVYARYARVLEQPASRRAVLRLEQLDGLPSVLEPVGPMLRGSEIPTAIIWGQPDPYFRARELEHLRAALPHAVVTGIPGGGHFPQEDAASVVTQALLAFLE